MSNKKSVELGNRYIMEVQVNNKAIERNTRTFCKKYPNGTIAKGRIMDTYTGEIYKKSVILKPDNRPNRHPWNTINAYDIITGEKIGSCAYNPFAQGTGLIKLFFGFSRVGNYLEKIETKLLEFHD